MTKFSDLALDPRVLQGRRGSRLRNPHPDPGAGHSRTRCKGRDVLGIAQTGTGKTASFTLPMITLLGQGRARARMPRSLVLAPTRELAAQVAENFDTYAKHTKLTKALLIGGVVVRRTGQADRPRRRRADRHPRPPAGPFRARQAAADRRADHGGGRGRPDARHGLHPRYRAHLPADPVHPPDAVLQRHHGARDRADHQHLPDEPGQDRSGASGHRLADHRAEADRVHARRARTAALPKSAPCCAR